MPKKLTQIILDEVSLVDNPANKGARVAIFKRGLDPEPIIALCKSMYSEDAKPDFRQALEDELKRQRLSEIHEQMWPILDALQESVMTAAAELEGEARDNKIRDNVNSFLSTVTEALGGINPSKGEDTMEPKELAKKLESLEKSNEALEKKFAKTEEDRAKLAEALKAAGVIVKEDGSVEVTAAVEKKADDEFITIEGEKVLKSAVPVPVLKQLEAANTRLAALEKSQLDARITKRAEDELPNLAGSPAAKGEILKAIDGIQSEELRKEATEALKAADAAVGKLFSEVGKSAGGESDAEVELDKLAKAHASEHNVSYEAAYTAVIQTKKGMELRKQLSN